MALDAKAVIVTPSATSAAATHRAPAVETNWTASNVATHVLRPLDTSHPRFITQVPLPLDVLGGMGQYVGALVLSLPLAEHVCVAVQRKDDLSLSVCHVGQPAGIAAGVKTITLDRLVEGDCIAEPEALADLVSEIQDEAVLCVVGTLAECVRQGLLPVTALSSTVSYGVTTNLGHDVDIHASLMSGAVVALAKAFDIEVSPVALHHVFEKVQTAWLGRAIGLGGIGAILQGEAHAIVQVRHNPYTYVGSLPLPDDLTMVGIDTGVIQANAHEKYTKSRVASQMGCEIVSRIVKHDELTDMRWDGRLSRLTINDYIERFRDRLPAQIKGSDYLSHFGPINDSLAPVRPSVMYKVRSRTEHHIYEHARAGQFIEALARAIRTKTIEPLIEAGDLMYASHWSYGQRSGLGAIETDLLVNILRQYGQDCGIYGAKISGHGCGGCVVVLLRQSEQSKAALDSAMADYHQQTSLSATLLSGSLPGTCVSGACRA